MALFWTPAKYGRNLVVTSNYEVALIDRNKEFAKWRTETPQADIEMVYSHFRAGFWETNNRFQTFKYICTSVFVNISN